MTSNIINLFDAIAFIVLIGLNIWFGRNKHNLSFLHFTLLFFLLGIILPLISFEVEWQLVNPPTETFDSFTMLYTYFKFPMYCLIFIIQIVIIHPNLRKQLFEYQRK